MSTGDKSKLSEVGVMRAYRLEFSEAELGDILGWMYEHLKHGSVREELYQKLKFPEDHESRGSA